MKNSILGIFIIACGIYLATWGQLVPNPSDIANLADKSKLSAQPQTPTTWPPQLGKPYPDLALPNYDGKTIRLSDFKGKIVIIEPIGMTCPACNAFAGGSTLGTMPGIEKGNMPSFEEFFVREMKDVSYDDPNIIHISLLLYNLSMQGPVVEDAQVWAEHFKLAGRTNHYVLAGGPKLVNNASYAMIPGFQLIDKQGVLRSDAAGHNPHDSLRALLLMVPQLLKE